MDVEAYENPVDIQIIKGVDKAMPYMYRARFTPNQITTLSMLVRLMSAILLYNGYGLPAAACYFVGYWLDCADGYFARRYKTESVLGDFYDHTVDVMTTAIILYVMYLKGLGRSHFLVIALFAIVLQVNVGCREKIVNGNSKTLEETKRLCRDDKMIKHTRYFGAGTFTIVMCIYIAYVGMIK